MLPVETDLHLHLKLSGCGGEINDLAAVGRKIAPAVSCELIAKMCWDSQQVHWERLRSGEGEVVCERCCRVHHNAEFLVRRGSRKRRLKTSSGEVVFRLQQLTCRVCGRTWSPYPELLGLAPRQRVSDELLQLQFESVVDLSFGKSTRLADAWLGSSVSERTLHRAVQERGSRVAFTAAPGLKTVVADGTRVRTGEKKTGEEYCIVYQIVGRGKQRRRPAVQKRVVGFGIGIEGWDTAFAAVPTQPRLVVTDGEHGIRGRVARYFPRARPQLCEWHVPYSLKYLMLMDGGLSLKRRKEIIAELYAIIDRGDEKAFARVSRSFPRGSYSRTYLENAAPHIMYPKPSVVRTTSWAERQMRELNRRTDVGVKWSMTGVANLIRLKLAKLHNPDDYERIWTKPNPLAWNLVPRG